MSACLGCRKKPAEDRQPLLPQYNDETSRQRELHKKLHTYQQLRALSMGYMPTTEQAVANLRTILAADLLNPDATNANSLSPSGKALVKYARQWLVQFMDLVQHKNEGDKVQDLIWYLKRSKVEVDVRDIGERVAVTKVKKDTAAAYQSVKTVGNLLLLNPDFRIFLADLNTVLREVFRDTAFTISEVAKDTGRKLDPSVADQEAVSKPGADDGPAPSGDELTDKVTEVTQLVGHGAAEVAKDTQHNLADKFSGGEKDTLLNRVKQAILRLRKRPDYNDSVSTLSLLLRRYAKVYTSAAEETVKTVEDDVNSNKELDEALKGVWELIISFGDRAEWEELERRFKQILQSRKKDPEVEKIIDQTGDSVQKLLTEPDFLNHADEKFEELKTKAQEAGTESDLRKDMNSLISQVQRVLQSVIHDKDIEKLVQTTSKELVIVSPANEYINKDLLRDSINVFVPQVLRTIQYVPIPRVEVSTPEIDLLLENIILEPGETVNHSSFLPYKLHVNTDNNFAIYKGRVGTGASADTTITIDIAGLSVRAQDIGYVMHIHPNSFIRFTDVGLASFRMDKRGLDLSITFEIRRNEPDTILHLRDVKTTIHTLDYKLRRSKFSCAAWLFGPLLRPIIRKSLEHVISSSVADALRTANREVVFARERLRATRVADPDDLMTFIRAVAARWTPEPDPNLDVRVGVDSVGDVFGSGRGKASTRVGASSQIGWDGKAKGVGVFRGVYAPGSVVKVWHEEADRAQERVEDGEVRARGWRNEIFDVTATTAGNVNGMGTIG